MKNRFIKLICVVLVMLYALSNLNVFAEDTQKISITISYNRQNGEITVSGNAPLALNNEESVRLLILKPGTDTDALQKGNVTFPQVGIHADETAMKDDKSFEFEKVTFPENVPAGDYVVIVAAGDEVYEDLIPFATEKQVFEKISGVFDPEEIKTNILKYNDVYDLKIEEGSDYQRLSDKGKDFVLLSLCNKEFITKEELKKEFEKSTQLYRICEGPWGIVQNVIENNSSLLGLDLSDYNNLGDNKVIVCKALAGNLYNTEAELKTAFERAVDANKITSGSSDSRPSGSSSKGGSSNISMQVQVPKTPEPTIAPNEDEMVFGDLYNHSWAQESIEKLYKKGIVNGKADGIFAPDDAITRAEAVKMIVSALSVVNENAVCSFSDVAESSWMYPYVATAAENGFVNGYDDNWFGASDAITREDFAVMILRVLNAKGENLEINENMFFDDDVDIAEYAKEAVYKLKSAGVINGMGENSFVPKATATRAQAAKIIASILG